MTPLHHVLLPCKMTSQRIPRKNLCRIGGRSLLDLQIDRFQSWFPGAAIWVATEDGEVAEIAKRRSCRIFGLSETDLLDRRNVDELFEAWLADRLPSERCLYHQVTSPFTFRSELERAIDDPRPYCRSAWRARFFLLSQSSSWPLSQHQREDAIVTGNFGVGWGQGLVEPKQITPVSLLSSIDIDTPADLMLADRIASAMKLDDFDDLR